MMKKIVLIGGGHSHAIALKYWQTHQLENVKIILVSDVQFTPYSGMLPGLIAGLYSYEESHIDLKKLAQSVSAQLIIDRVVDIEPEPDRKQVICASGKIVEFDLLSIDIGSTPSVGNIKGARRFATPAKPVPQLLEKWQEIIERAQSEKQLHQPLNISIIGGGIGGVELALNMEYKLQQMLPDDLFNINLIHQGQRLISDRNETASKLITQVLRKQKIKIYLQTQINQVNQKSVISKTGEKIRTDYCFLVTQADAPDWLKENEIVTDEKGFILVTQTLQTINYPYIFATGDISAIENNPRPKAGVFAVRQGKPLAKNIIKYLSKSRLESFKPQQKYLSIIGISNVNGIAIWGERAWKSPFFWYGKKYLDFNFIKQFK